MSLFQDNNNNYVERTNNSPLLQMNSLNNMYNETIRTIQSILSINQNIINP